VPVEKFAGAIIDVMLPNHPLASGIATEESRGGFLTGVCSTGGCEPKIQTSG
jgi:hypothetical protein